MSPISQSRLDLDLDGLFSEYTSFTLSSVIVNVVIIIIIITIQVIIVAVHSIWHKKFVVLLDSMCRRIRLFSLMKQFLRRYLIILNCSAFQIWHIFLSLYDLHCDYSWFI